MKKRKKQQHKKKTTISKGFHKNPYLISKNKKETYPNKF